MKPPVVIIPVKNRLDLTSPLVDALLAQGGYHSLLVYDNGSTDGTADWLDESAAGRVHADGWTLHEMWNGGITTAGMFGAPAVFLNNDIEIHGDDWLKRLCDGLDETGYSAVCPNYDGRTAEGIEPLNGIAAGKEDGTGGLAGFAFAVHPRFLRDYRFPTDLKWWCGDADMVCTMDLKGFAYGMVTNVAVTHIEGGSQTAKDHDLADTIRADRTVFREKWKEYYSFA